MRTMFLGLAMLALTGCGAAAPVQTVAPVRAIPPQPARDAAGNILSVPIIIPDGTEVSAQTLDFLSSEKSSVGDPVKMEVDNNVLIDGAVAIPAGTSVRGTIANVTHASRMGRSGSISIRVESTEAADGQRVPLRATKAQTEGDKTGSTIAMTLLVSPLFLLKRGDDVAYQPGTKITAYTDGKLSIKAWKR